VKRRTLTGDESLALHCIWGSYIWRIFPQVTLVDDTFNQSYIDTLVGEFGFSPPVEPLRFGNVGVFAAEPGVDRAFIFAPSWAGIPVLSHEIGHAIAWATYGDASLEWGEEKAEAFAMLSDVNAICRKIGGPQERRQFARHIRMNRRCPVYRAALRRAWKTRNLPLKKQIEEIAGGP
jgi:hypothetical protein